MWYYIRIFAWISGVDDLTPYIDHWKVYGQSFLRNDKVKMLLDLQKETLFVAEWCFDHKYLDPQKVVGDLILYLHFMLKDWELSLEELTEMNYQKLANSVNHHGWKAEEDLTKMNGIEYKRLSQNEWINEKGEPFQTNFPEQEDWREAMQKRIALNREESIKNRGRWY